MKVCNIILFIHILEIFRENFIFLSKFLKM